MAGAVAGCRCSTATDSASTCTRGQRLDFGLQIAGYMGFRKIFYLGQDLKDRGSITHFHSAHDEQTEYPRMRKMFCHAANLLAARDVAVYNCSAESTLECFPKVSYE